MSVFSLISTSTGQSSEVSPVNIPCGAVCRGRKMWVKYTGVHNNAVKHAFKTAGFLRTQSAHWNVLWGGRLALEGYKQLNRYQRVRLQTCCDLISSIFHGWTVIKP